MIIDKLESICLYIQIISKYIKSIKLFTQILNNYPTIYRLIRLKFAVSYGN